MCTRAIGWGKNSARHRTKISLTGLLVHPLKKRTHLALNEEWFSKYTSKALGNVSECYVAKIKESREIVRLGKLATVISKNGDLRKSMRIKG